MDDSVHAAGVFDKLAERYRDKYMDVTMYEESYREFCDLLPPGRARVLDAACGPGNVTRYLMTRRPDLDLLGIDLAPRMVELARRAVPAARFAAHDCRALGALNQRFDGIMCAFGLPYLSPEEAAGFIDAASNALERNGVLYLSTMLGRSEDSGFELCSTGDQIYVHYHNAKQIVSALEQGGLTLVRRRRVQSPSTAPKVTTDLIVIAKK